jgi:hypothetical protein
VSYKFAPHARVTDRDHLARHGSIVRRGAGSFGPLYGVRWDDGKCSLENEYRLRPAHGGAAHRNHSARGKRAWKHRNRALGVVGTASVGGSTVKLKGRLEVVGKVRRKKIVEASEMPGDEFFAVPEDAEAIAPIAKGGTGRRRSRGRLTKSAYLDAAEARGNIPPDQLVAFDAVWRSLWPTGLATLTERFAEWVEEHPADLAEYQGKYVAKREKQLEREQRAQEKAAARRVA